MVKCIILNLLFSTLSFSVFVASTKCNPSRLSLALSQSRPYPQPK